MALLGALPRCRQNRTGIEYWGGVLRERRQLAGSKRKAGADRFGSGLNSLAPVWASLGPQIPHISRDLGGQNARRQEEQQLLCRRADVGMFEQITHHRDAAE